MATVVAPLHAALALLVFTRSALSQSRCDPPEDAAAFLQLTAQLSRDTQLTYSDFFNHVKQTTAFTKYKALTDSVTAQSWVGMLFDKAARCSMGTDPSGLAMCSHPDTTATKIELRVKDNSRAKGGGKLNFEKELYDQVDILLDQEGNLMTKRKAHIDTLWAKACSGELSAALAAAGGQDASYNGDPLAFARASSDQSTKIDNAITTAEADCAGGKCWRHGAIGRLYDMLVPIHPRYRPTGIAGQKYTSSVGGEYLFRYAMNKIPDTMVASKDLAMYAYTALVASQIFPDGNKRSGRALYTLVWSQIPGSPLFEGPSFRCTLPFFDM